MSNTRSKAKKKGQDTVFQEPTTKWRKSKAKELLYDDLVEEKIPLIKEEGEDVQQYYLTREEFQKYDPDRFEERLDSLRATINFRYERARVDMDAYQQFKAHHPPSLYSKKGYIQWKGSDAHRLLTEDLCIHGYLETMSAQELYNTRPEYYENFDSDVFYDKVQQEIKTEKYLQTLKAKGKTHKSS